MEGAAGKRKDLMDNIKARLNSGAYNRDRFFKKNEKDLKAKVKFFEDKRAKGEMKPFMAPRYEQAKAMLAQLQGVAAAAAAVNSPVVNLNAPLNLLAPAPSLAPVVAVSAPRKARTMKKKPNAVPATVGERPAGFQEPLRIRIPTTRRGRPKTVRNSLKVAAPLSTFAPLVAPGARLSGISEVNESKLQNTPLFVPGVGVNAGSLSFSNVPPAAAPVASAVAAYNPFNSPVAAAGPLSVGPNMGQSRRKRMPQVMNEHLLKAISETEHLIPEFYDPYTGLKFGPDESPMEKIEQAYKELQQLRAATWKKASTYRRKAAAGKGGRRRL
uniref:Uncharacterized protein n=1 Tax=viral metagenome TaxID=1070528 RepID=A0A6C0KBR0_9ZZZZ